MSYLKAAEKVHDGKTDYVFLALELAGATDREAQRYMRMFIHYSNHLKDPTRGWWGKNTPDAREARVYSLLLAHCMRETGDLPQ